MYVAPGQRHWRKSPFKTQKLSLVSLGCPSSNSAVTSAPWFILIMVTSCWFKKKSVIAKVQCRLIGSFWNCQNNIIMIFMFFIPKYVIVFLQSRWKSTSVMLWIPFASEHDSNGKIILTFASHGKVSERLSGLHSINMWQHWFS